MISCRFANLFCTELAKRQLYFPFMQWVGVTPTHYLYKDRLLFVFRPAYAKTQIKSAYYRLIKATDRNLRLYSATEGEGIYIERSKVRYLKGWRIANILIKSWRNANFLRMSLQNANKIISKIKSKKVGESPTFEFNSMVYWRYANFIMDTVWDVGEMPTMKKLFFYRFKKFYTVI